MRRSLLLVSLLMSEISFSFASITSGLTNFDYPFLIGDWYVINPSPETTSEDFLNIRLKLSSDYSFTIDIQKKDLTHQHWKGSYYANEQSLIIGINSEEPQTYAYDVGHNQLYLNGVQFTKYLPDDIAGYWTSQNISGSDILASNVSKMDIVLQPDFVFLLVASDDEGNEAIQTGVYYVENAQLILRYQDGEHDSMYTLNEDILTLTSNGFDMQATLNRVR